jgi:flagellar operon protein
MGYRVINGVMQPVGNFPINNERTGQSTRVAKDSEIKGFGDILKERINKDTGFTISKHAAERMENVSMSPLDMNKINAAIDKAKDKGSKNCLIVYKDMAMITSVDNRTVITAVESSRARDNVFTNIDSVILL